MLGSRWPRSDNYYFVWQHACCEKAKTQSVECTQWEDFHPCDACQAVYANGAPEVSNVATWHRSRSA